MILDDVLKAFTRFLKHGNDDYVDRFHYLYSVIGLSVYLFFITSKQYLGEPLTCMPHVNGDFNKYAHSMCWINGTYHFEFKNTTASTLEIDPDRYKQIRYYQWIIFIILFEIALFTLPSLIWNFFMHLNGFDMIHVTNNVIKNIYLNEYSSNANWSSTLKTIDGVTDHIQLSFLSQKKSSFHKKLNITKMRKSEKKSDEKAYLRQRYPNLKTKPAFPLYLPYLLTKLIYLGQVIGHFFMLGHIFDIDYFRFGPNVFQSIMNNKFKFLNEFFPKRALCDVQYFTKWKANQYTILCSLPLNLFNEIFYFGFWYWLLFIGLMTLCSIIYWLIILFKPYRRHVVLKALQISKADIKSSFIAAYYLNESNNCTFDSADAFLLDKTGLNLMDNFELFFNHVCSIDVIFAVKMISINTNQLAMRDILNNLWDQYLDLEELKTGNVKQRPHLTIRRPPPYVNPHDTNNLDEKVKN